ncbi:MAG: DUF4293 domain-containing protein [Sphingobacteriales bacterium]|nr:DUF4293 domain-containing protein [Sphingobacteriales bacterium]
MLQRIQTVYFFLAGLCGLLFQYFPTVEINDIAQKPAFNPIMAGIGALISIACFLIIFLFKKRPLQATLALINGIAIIGLIVFVGMTEYSDGDFIPQLGALFPPLMFLFNSLGIRGVRSDEKLVRSMDRLR